MANRRVFVYDPLDVPEDWLRTWELELTHATPLRASGRARPKMTAEDLVLGARGHQALLGGSGARITKEVLDALPELRFVAKLGIGWEVIDVAAATARGVVVTNSPAHSEVELVAEHTIGLMLACLKQFTWYNTAYVRDGGWRDGGHLLGSLTGSSIGIIGYGNIGRAVARRLQGWGVELLVHDVRPVVPEAGETVELEPLLRRADLVTLHTPAMRDEPPLLDRKRLDLLKPGAVVINTARGSLIDRAALAELLTSGRIAAAGVDVFEPEPPTAEDPLLSAPNVFATPHVAAWNPRVRLEMVEMALSGLRDLFDGKVPPHVVNHEVLRERDLIRQGES